MCHRTVAVYGHMAEARRRAGPGRERATWSFRHVQSASDLRAGDRSGCIDHRTHALHEPTPDDTVVGDPPRSLTSPARAGPQRVSSVRLRRHAAREIRDRVDQRAAQTAPNPPAIAGAAPAAPTASVHRTPRRHGALPSHFEAPPGRLCSAGTCPERQLYDPKLFG